MFACSESELQVGTRHDEPHAHRQKNTKHPRHAIGNSWGQSSQIEGQKQLEFTRAQLHTHTRKSHHFFFEESQLFFLRKTNFVAFGLVQLFFMVLRSARRYFPFVPQREWYRDIKKYSSEQGKSLNHKRLS